MMHALEGEGGKKKGLQCRGRQGGSRLSKTTRGPLKKKERSLRSNQNWDATDRYLITLNKVFTEETSGGVRYFQVPEREKKKG